MSLKMGDGTQTKSFGIVFDIPCIYSKHFVKIKS